MRCFYRTYLPGRWGQLHLRIAPGPSEAPPLVMLHQTPKSGWIWEPLFEILCARRTLIAPDTPGYGASDAPPEDTRIEDYAGEILALVEHLTDECVIERVPFDVIGYHTGSVIAAELGCRAPERVRRLVLVSLPAYTETERSGRAAKLPKEPNLAEDGSHLLAMWDLVTRLSDVRTSLQWRHESFVENLRAGCGAYRGYHAVYRFDLLSALERLAKPVLLLNPSDDLHDVTARSAHLLRDAQVVELPDMSHGLFAVWREDIAALIDDFLGANS